MPTLPELPQVALEVASVTELEPPGFLALKRYELHVVGPAGKSSEFSYDVVDRRALDAAIMVAHTVGKDGQVEVYLRSAIRPPLALRPGGVAPITWEVPAGLIEPGEEPVEAAVRELEEELGFAVTPSEMKHLGPWGYPAPACIGEKHYFFHVRVDPSTRRDPGGDGSPLEDVAVIEKVPLTEAIAACASGLIRDEKTELALRRLADIVQ